MERAGIKRVGIRDLRSDLSNQVRRAALGESVVVTIDGEPKAMLVPINGSGKKQTREEMIASGNLIPAKRHGEPPPPVPPRFKGGRPSREILDEIRADRIP